MGWMYCILEQKMSYIMQIIYLVSGENIVFILDVKTTFSQIKQKKSIISKRII